MIERLLFPSLVHFILLFTITLLSIASFIPSVHAQSFQPITVSFPPNAFVEGKGLYVLGGTPHTVGKTFTQAFMLDLSVSWNTSAPTLKKLADSQGGMFASCSLLSNSDDILLLSYSVAYIYNTKSDKWRSTIHNMLPLGTVWTMSAADPETGLVYLIYPGAKASGTTTQVDVVNLNTQTLSVTSQPISSKALTTVFNSAVVWSAHLRSIVIPTMNPNVLYVFTPSKANETSQGWSTLKVTGTQPDFDSLTCFVSAYGGSKLVVFNSMMGNTPSTVHILDVDTGVWKKSTGGPSTTPMGSACAISGDQFVTWGNLKSSTEVGTTSVYDMTTDKWTSNYVAPTLPSPTPSASASPTPAQNTPTTTSKSEDTSMSEKKLVIIITIVTGVLLTIILTTITVYLVLSKRLKSDTQSASLDDTSDYEGASIGSLRKHKSNKSGLFGRLHLGPFGTRPLSEHPHLIVEEGLAARYAQEGDSTVELISQHPHATIEEELAKRNAQEGAVEMELISQHPHTTIEEEMTKRNVQEGAIEVELVSQHPHAVMDGEMENHHEQKGAFGIEMVSQHPYAMVKEELAKRNAEKGAFAMELVSQHPHAVVEEETFTAYHSKAELEPTRDWGDKAELE
ncbi:MAG: hypothetical protein J3Q66DRAFT_375592 [Benniella sp.]|nr:MAG: hypothetical protein J3Q66DRAFT_375592 [Benniella sp.]